MTNLTLDYDLGCLLCPNCGEFTLHHDAVEVFAREEDGEAKVIDGVTGAVLPQPRGPNPSSRRQGLAVSFWCENCRCLPRLTIAQHKGQSLIGWAEPMKFCEPGKHKLGPQWDVGEQ